MQILQPNSKTVVYHKNLSPYKWSPRNKSTKLVPQEQINKLVPWGQSFPKSCSMLKDLFPPFLKQFFKLKHARLVYVLQISLLSCSTCTTCFDKNLDSVELHIPWAACGTAHQLQKQIKMLSCESLVYVFIFSLSVITAFRVSWFSTSQTYLGLLRPPQFRSLLGSSQAFSDRHCPSTIASAVLKVQKSKLRLGEPINNVWTNFGKKKKRSGLP